MTEETRKKISESVLKNWEVRRKTGKDKCPESVKRKLSEMFSGDGNPAKRADVRLKIKIKATTHDMTNTPTYRTWQAMKRRCYNKSAHNYKSYGARGIIVCEQWINSFETFLKDMGQREKWYCIDRINHNGNYEPANCRWVSHKESSSNKRKKL